jgi:hypothetical protein
VLLQLLQHVASGLLRPTEHLDGRLRGRHGLLGVLLELLQDLIRVRTLGYRRGRGDGVVDALDGALAELQQALSVGAQLVTDARAQVVEEDGARHLNHARLNALRL